MVAKTILGFLLRTSFNRFTKTLLKREPRASFILIKALKLLKVLKFSSQQSHMNLMKI